MLFYLQTFGCKSNQYESQSIRESLLQAGFSETASPEFADIYILNSCGVSSRAAASCRNALRKTYRKNPALRLILTGCGVDLAEQWPVLNGAKPVLVPNGKKYLLPEAARTLAAADSEAARELIESGAEDRLRQRISSFAGHTRAFLKIQDGCDNHCRYCAVPRARGEPRSRPAAEVLAEAARLVQHGHKEIVLTGINIGAYRDDGISLADLLASLADTPGLERLRLGSVEPPYVTETLVQAMRANDAICNHIHIPLQSGDDAVLHAMGRRYDSDYFLDTIAMLRSALPHPAISSDVIVGFPGETETQFHHSVELCRKAEFSKLHVFLFSPRPGTPAAAMPRAVPDRVVEEWKTSLIAAAREVAEQYASRCIGLTERVIVENSASASPLGLSDRYLSVRLNRRDAKPGDVVRVEITGADGIVLLADNPPCKK